MPEILRLSLLAMLMALAGISRASEPVASVIRIGGQASGHRYLHCGGCGTDWHMVRVKCSHCESTQGIQYQTIEGDQGVVQAETCTACGSYRKIVNQEKDPLAEPLADDLASLMLDLLMSETRFQRASANPLLYVAVAQEQADTGQAGDRQARQGGERFVGVEPVGTDAPQL